MEINDRKPVFWHNDLEDFVKKNPIWNDRQYCPNCGTWILPQNCAVL